MKTNLRPCPFCGKKRHLRFEPFEGSTDTGIVVCICGASYTTIEQGADWNTRRIEDGLRAEVERLKTILTEIRVLARRTGLKDGAWQSVDMSKIAWLAECEVGELDKEMKWLLKQNHENM